MPKSIYEYSDYKSYLNGWIRSQPGGGHGLRGKIAAAVGCQTAFVSQVLKGDSHFSLEQAQRLNSFLHHGKEESRFFLLLLQFTRAGTADLRAYLKEEMEETLAKRTVLKERLANTTQLTQDDHSRYFSSWMFAAIHVQLTVPPFQTRDSIAASLHIAPERVTEILDFLESRGLAARKGERYSVGELNIHLGSDSAMIVKHHTNWRIKAMQSLEEEKKNDLHYSSVISLARGDIAKVKALLSNCLADVQKVVQPSEAEELFSLGVDFFGLNQNSK